MPALTIGTQTIGSHFLWVLIILSRVGCEAQEDASMYVVDAAAPAAQRQTHAPIPSRSS